MELKLINDLKDELLENGIYEGNNLIAGNSFCFESATWRGTMTATSFKGFLNDLVKIKKLGRIKLFGQTYYYNRDVWTDDILKEKIIGSMGS